MSRARSVPWIHPATQQELRDFRRGRVSRREFLTRVTALGTSALAARAMIGVAHAEEDGSTTPSGTTLRIQMEVRPLKDPRRYDWSEIANVSRGWLEYLVEYSRDGSLRGMLLDSWEASEDATSYLLNIRPGVTWTTGEPFTSADVARLMAYWCDRSVEGNSMAGRLAALLDPQTEQLAETAVEVIDDLTLRLHLAYPDVALMVGLSDYPAACVHESHDPETMLSNPIGTGPYLPEAVVPNERAALVRNHAHNWWGEQAEGWGGATLERIEFIDYGTDPAAWLQAAQNDEIDMLYENVGAFIERADTLGWERSEVVTGATVVLRGNQNALVDGRAVYAEPKMRKALQLAISNEIALELGHEGLGTLAENHHVAPVHPDYAEVGPTEYDPARALPLAEEAGLADVEHELVTLDDGLTRRTGDACSAMLRDAGLKVSRKVLPGSAFWQAWKEYPLSITEWNHRPLGIQVLALAYRSGEAWNETGYASPEFDALVAEALTIADAEARQKIMARIERKLQEDAVIVQPFWRSLYRHVRPGVTGAEMHPSFEIHLYKLGLKV
ncbi:diguanylate cyclase [Salipiger sp. CCB-MM3]|uniref:ABC transporter substrate-binding protein n=1 Tax=Salipiger sp. CCB-MM3 TaxID=1792508 RepID=UPI00080AA53C|nr:ABC transporter substrate-binding protein [Salipiger sp. CCB-MM3]ANT59265.1 diguanylate cyclase [Salipiger sp. CCB-MM3]